MPLTKSEIVRLRSLQEKKHRESSGLFVVEGEKVIGELLAENFPLREIYATDGWSAGPDVGGVKVVAITAAEMARISHYPSPARMLAVGEIAHRRLAPGALDHGLSLALDGVQDPGNVGALLRIADWFALDRVVLSPDCADLYAQKVINASMGSFARVAVHVSPLAEALARLRVPVLGCDLTGDDVHALRPVRDAVIVIGSEGRGLSPAVVGLVTQRLTIPRHGRAESLNAAVAAGIVCDRLRAAAYSPS